MLKIGEFARLSQVSLKTLRHYDLLGVLRPSRIDPDSGYRLYEMEQLAEMMRIQALKDCGFTLEEIAHMLQTSDVKAVEILLQQRLVSQQQLVAEEQARLQRMQARIKQLTWTNTISRYDVALRQTEQLTLLGLRQYVATTEEIGPLARKVVRHLEQQALVPIGPLIHLYFDEDMQEEGFDLFVGAPVAASPLVMTELRCEVLAGGSQVACVLHCGDYTNIGAAYTALDRWLSLSGYQAGGSYREIYHRSPSHTNDPSSYLTEIQYPLQSPRDTDQSTQFQKQETFL